MSAFEGVYKRYVKETPAKQQVKDNTPPAKANTIENSVMIKESVKRKKLTLISPDDPFKDPRVVTVEAITDLGFKLAPAEDFIGAKDTTYFLDVDNKSGRTTLVYDFQPAGNRGKPATHLYFSAHNSDITESLVCFASAANVGELRQLIEASKKLSPPETKTIHNIGSVEELITEVRKHPEGGEILIPN